jgi:hypothetical protein
LREQHSTLHDRAFDIGIAVQLHVIHCDQLREFIDELRAHAARENALYGWAQEHLKSDGRRQLLAVLR